MRVLLANPPFDEAESVGGTRSMKYVLNTIAPLGLAYLAAVAEQAGHDVHIVDCALGLTLDQLCRRAAALDPQVVGLTCTTPSWAGARDAAKALRRATPRAKLVIGGAHVTALPLATLAGGVFDAGVVGEGEATFAELLEAWASAPDADLAGIAGLVLPGDGQPRLTTPRALIQDVDSIPYPARHLLPRLSARAANAARPQVSEATAYLRRDSAVLASRTSTSYEDRGVTSLTADPAEEPESVGFAALVSAAALASSAVRFDAESP